MENNEQMQAFFDGLAPKWFDNENDRAAQQRIVQLADFPHGAALADVGCGRGVMFPYLLKAQPRSLTAVDLSSQMLAYAKKTYGENGITYCNCDVLEAPLEHLDAVMMYNTYPHFLDKKALADKMAHSICAGGMLVIAHSVSRHKINAHHSEGIPFVLSVPLRCAQEEAAEFSADFTPELLIDDDALFFVKLRRR
ncbi:MAG: class I SAM-dependent methyltransferase [Ruthenibacterium sp.]